MKLTLSILIIIIIIASVFALILFLFKAEPETHRNAFNKRVIKLLQSGKEKQIYDFFAEIVGDRTNAILILSAALSSDIPIHYFIAIGWQESRFKVKARHRQNKDGSIDYGMFGLNSKVYKQYTKEQLEEPVTNITFAAVKNKSCVLSRVICWLSRQSRRNKKSLHAKKVIRTRLSFFFAHELWNTRRRSGRGRRREENGRPSVRTTDQFERWKTAFTPQQRENVCWPPSQL